MAIVPAVPPNDWRRSELDEWKQEGGRTGYSSHIREVMADMRAGPGHVKLEDKDTVYAIERAMKEMKEKGVRTPVEQYMAKEMENFDRGIKGLSPLPDPQTSMNRASGAWAPPAHAAPAHSHVEIGAEPMRPAVSEYARQRFGL